MKTVSTVPRITHTEMSVYNRSIASTRQYPANFSERLFTEDYRSDPIGNRWNNRKYARTELGRKEQEAMYGETARLEWAKRQQELSMVQRDNKKDSEEEQRYEDYIYLRNHIDTAFVMFLFMSSLNETYYCWRCGNYHKRNMSF